MVKEKRIDRIIENMKKYDFEQLLISSKESIFYLTESKFDPGERMMVLYISVTGERFFIINDLFPINENFGIEVIHYNDSEDPIDILAKKINKTEILGVDKEWPSHFLIRLMKKLDGLKVEIGSITVDQVRMIKDEEEIIKMKNASKINDLVMVEIEDMLRTGEYSEIDIKKMIPEIYRKYGTNEISFSPSICYGPNAARPHHESDNTKLKKGNCIVVDIGGITEGYCSDMTRSFFCGEPTKEYVEIYNLVLMANLAAIKMVRPGIKMKDIDLTARKIIEDHGYGKYFTHRTGHGIGIQVHEYPDVSSVNDMICESGMCFSIEPGIYMENLYGVRIEDLVIVTDDGCEVINNYSKELNIF